MLATASSPAHASLSKGIEYHLRYTVGKKLGKPSKQDICQALSYTLRGRLIDGLLKSEETFRRKDAKRLVYLSAEFLIGQSLRNNLFNLGLLGEAERATRELGFDLAEIADAESDAPL
jgi:glycogen phosphorylase